MHTYIKNAVAHMKEGKEIVSQALLGERVLLEGDYIITPDGYRGIVDPSALVHCKEAYTPSKRVVSLMAHIYGSPEIKGGPLKTLSYGTPLDAFSIDERWSQIELPDGSQAFIQNGDIATPCLLNRADIAPFSFRFLGLPYTWGGRSSFGFDCSGFVQMLYKEMGISLPRDSKDQFLACEKTDVPQIADLIFWGKSEREIKHVGMYLGGGKFIHASARENKPWIRISSLDDKEWSAQIENDYPFRAAAFSK